MSCDGHWCSDGPSLPGLAAEGDGHSPAGSWSVAPSQDMQVGEFCHGSVNFVMVELFLYIFGELFQYYMPQMNGHGPVTL